MQEQVLPFLYEGVWGWALSLSHQFYPYPGTALRANLPANTNGDDPRYLLSPIAPA